MGKGCGRKRIEKGQALETGRKLKQVNQLYRRLKATYDEIDALKAENSSASLIRERYSEWLSNYEMQKELDIYT